MSGEEYREGCDPVQDPEEIEEKRGEWFRTKGAPPRPPEKDQVPGEDENLEKDEEMYTAVLLVQRHNGVVMPMTNIAHLKIHHQASPHEVLRMCMDVADQVSSVRVIGEVLRGLVEMNSKTVGQMARMFQTMMGKQP